MELILDPKPYLLYETADMIYSAVHHMSTLTVRDRMSRNHRGYLTGPGGEFRCGPGQFSCHVHRLFWCGFCREFRAEGAAYVSAYGKEFFCGTLSGQLTLAGLAGEQEIVYVGLGSLEEIKAAGGVEGKIVLVQRGTLTFDEKLANADAAGAIGAIMFNNAPGAFVPFITYDFPLGLLTMEEGLDLLSLLPDGVHGTITVLNEFNSQAVDMAIDSSWGSTPDLRITPEISAPRDGITSAIGFGDDASYDTWSGTSMATPHVSAGLSLIKQYVRSLFPDRGAKEINELTYAFAMSTARQVNGFVR